MRAYKDFVTKQGLKVVNLIYQLQQIHKHERRHIRTQRNWTDTV